jgi:hypothetical protein
MILGIIITTIFIFLLYGFELFKSVGIVKAFSVLLGFLIFYALLFTVTDNSDWEIYNSVFDGYRQSNDFIFNFICDFFSSHGYEYSAVYQFHILLMGIGFIYFISRFSIHGVFAVISIYLLLQLIPLSNQIRYFIAFPLFLISVYELIISKNKILFAIFTLLSFLSHAGIILMYPFLFIYYKTENENFIRKLLIYSALFSILFFIIYRIGLIFFGQFEYYFETEMLSSIKGGIFNSLILIVWILYIYFRNKVLVISNQFEIESDIKYQFLYKLSLYSIIFIPTGIIIQIISHRFVEASIIVWVTYIMYSFKYNFDIKRRILDFTIFLILVVGSFLYIYILPEYLLGVSNIEAVLNLFESNTLFNFI